MASKTVRAYKHDPCYDAGFLQVSTLHKLHYEQYGKREGIPVVFLHGGPGGSTSIASTVFFDPAVYRVVVFDQRGSGQSLPLGEVRENQSEHLCADIEQVRKHLDIDKWHVFGGSWGSTLALFYAQTYPDRVLSLALRGVFMESKEELDFNTTYEGSWRLHPEVYEEFIGFLPENERGNIWAGYYTRLTSGDRDLELAAAKLFNKWASTMAFLMPPDAKTLKSFDEESDADHVIAHARIECYYHKDNAWFENLQFLEPENIDKIKHIPCEIVNGRYDLLCPPITAWKLHKALPNSKLHIIPDAGHASMEPGTQTKLVEIMDRFAKL